MSLVKSIPIICREEVPLGPVIEQVAQPGPGIQILAGRTAEQAPFLVAQDIELRLASLPERKGYGPPMASDALRAALDRFESRHRQEQS